MAINYKYYLSLEGSGVITEGAGNSIATYFRVSVSPSIVSGPNGVATIYFSGTSSLNDWEYLLSGSIVSDGQWHPGTASLNLIFNQNQNVQNIYIRATQDINFEGDETLVATYTNTNDILNPSKYTLTIKDNFIEKFTEIKGTNNNDNFISSYANEQFDGLFGLDSVKYSGSITSYETNKFLNGTRVVNYKSEAKITSEIIGTDTITNIERLIFTDSAIAFDLDRNAGNVAKEIGAVFGKQAVSNKYFVGIGLSILDAGWTYDALSGLALDAAGAKTNDQIVSLLWTNVIGTKPTAADKQPFIALLENGMSAGALAHLAADTSFNTTNINLVGLVQTGIEYIPVV